MKHKIDTDIDIDVLNRDQILNAFPQHKRASMMKLDVREPHPTGVYFQPIPVENGRNIATIPYEEAEALGYFKIDFINVNVYKDVLNEKHLQELIDREPNWDLLQIDDVVTELFHINNYPELCRAMAPRSIEELAMLLAVIRPGKKHLRYKPWDEIKKSVWVRDTEEYYFKKSHAISYAMAIVVQLNLLTEKLSV